MSNESSEMVSVDPWDTLNNFCFLELAQKSSHFTCLWWSVTWWTTFNTGYTSHVKRVRRAGCQLKMLKELHPLTLYHIRNFYKIKKLNKGKCGRIAVYWVPKGGVVATNDSQWQEIQNSWQTVFSSRCQENTKLGKISFDKKVLMVV